MLSQRSCEPGRPFSLWACLLSQGSCEPDRPFLLDLLMKGSVYFANSDEVVLQSDSPGALIYKYS